jgi:hypothetical protein
MPHFALGGLRPVFDLGQQVWLDPDAPMRDLPAVGLGLADKGFEAGLQSFADAGSKP